MKTMHTTSVINSWETARYELLNTRICDLRLDLDGSPLKKYVRRLHRELALKGFKFRPRCYLTDSWGCPNEVPVIGIPFYLADKRLARIEEEQTGEIEDGPTIMMFLRHETGHAINYAYRLWEHPGWTATFGSFRLPYHDTFKPNPASRQFVRHLFHSQYGRNYAQKHPDEDFAETFAIWLTPRSAWQRKYRFWPALNKLRYVSRLMRGIRHKPPVTTNEVLLNPVAEMTTLLVAHYGQRAERYRAAAQGYVDDKLREIFPPVRGRRLEPAAELIATHRDALLERVTRWSGLGTDDVEIIVGKVEDRAALLQLRFHARAAGAKILDLTALVTALAVDFNYTGRFTF